MKIENHSGRKSTKMFLENIERVKNEYSLNPNLTQREVAEKVGLHPVTVNKIVKYLRDTR